MQKINKSKIGIVIVNFNNRKVIANCLYSLKKANIDHLVAVVDNASNDGSKRLIESKFKKVTILPQNQNLGFAGGNNKGIEFFLNKNKDYILILNPDTVVNRDALPGLLEVFDNKKNAGIVGPKILGSNDKIWSLGGEIDKKRYSGGLIGLGQENNKNNQIRKVDYVSGTAMLIKRKVFEKVGLFAENYFIYYEDVEFCLNASKKGYCSYIYPEVSIKHLESSTFGEDSPRHQYYMARNHLIFIRRNAPLNIKLREMIRLPKTIYEHIRRNENYALKGIKDFFLGKRGKL